MMSTKRSQIPEYPAQKAEEFDLQLLWRLADRFEALSADAPGPREKHDLLMCAVELALTVCRFECSPASEPGRIVSVGKALQTGSLRVLTVSVETPLCPLPSRDEHFARLHESLRQSGEPVSLGELQIVASEAREAELEDVHMSWLDGQDARTILEEHRIIPLPLLISVPRLLTFFLPRRTAAGIVLPRHPLFLMTHLGGQLETRVGRHLLRRRIAARPGGYWQSGTYRGPRAA
jgi:hypothetical protein